MKHGQKNMQLIKCSNFEWNHALKVITLSKYKSILLYKAEMSLYAKATRTLDIPICPQVVF